MSKGKIDIRMGGRYRDRDEAISGVPGGNEALKQYIQELFANSTFNWSQITGAPTMNEDFRTYIENLLELIELNQYAADQQITQDMKNYFSSLLDNITITWDQIIGSPTINEEFQTYLQTLLDNLTIAWTQITGAPILTTEVKQYIDNLVTELTESLQQFIIDNTVTEEVKQYIDNILNDIKNQLQEVQNQTTINETLLTEIAQTLQTLETTVQEIEEGDTITQEYIDYITQQFETINQTLQEISEGSTYTTELKQYIDNYLTEVTQVLQELITNQVTNELKEFITEVTNINGESTRLISGTITHIANLDFLVSPLVYQILNNRYQSAEKTITIPANAENNPRFAVIYADVFGQVGYILGDAAVTPAVPHVNDSTQIHLTTIYIPALGTSPTPDPDGETGDIATTVIYDEGTEWTPAKTEEANVTINLVDETLPDHGTKHISFDFAAGTATSERAKLNITEASNGWGTLTVAENTTEFNMDLALFFADHKTDTLTGTLRRLIYYTYKKISQIQARIKDRATGLVYYLDLTAATFENFAVPELGFSVPVPKTLSFKTTFNGLGGTWHQHILEPGTYDVILYYFDRNEQQYNILADETATLIEPTVAQVKLTAAAPVSWKDGRIVLSLKNSVPLLVTSGLLITLFSAGKKAGSVALVPGNYRDFNPSYTADYQRLSIPVSAFKPTADLIDEMIIKPVNAWPADCTFLVDHVILQTGLKLPEQNVKPNIEDQNFEYRDVSEAGQIYTLDLDASFNYEIQEVVVKTNAGTISAAVKINNTAVTGLSALALTDIKQSVKSTGANKVSPGDAVTLEILGLADDASALIGKVRFIRL